MSTTRPRPAVLFALCSVALAVSACGGGSAGPGATSSPVPTTSPSATASTPPSPTASGTTTTAGPTQGTAATPAFTGTLGPVVKAGMPTPASLLTAMRTAHQDGYDRVVLQLDGVAPGYRVAYVDRVVEDPSGRTLSLAGDANLQIVLRGATTDTTFQTTPGATPRSYRGSTRLLPDLPSVKEVRVVGDFEAVLSVAVGVDHKVPFRVFRLRNPTRVVVDVQAEQHG